MKITYSYSIRHNAILSSPVFSEASKEELRVLLALIAKDGKAASPDELSRLAAASKARCIAALTLWEEAGIIEKNIAPCREKPTITDEFDERIAKGEIIEESSVEVADGIRDENLAGALYECARLMGKPQLNTQEIKNISALSTQYALSSEYISLLGAYLASNGRKLTAVRLRDEGIKLYGLGITTSEELEKYIEQKKGESSAEWELRRLLGIYNRNVTKSEREYFNRWCEELGFSLDVIAEAFDISVLNTGKLSLSYMNKLLTAWHDAGCKTLAECKGEAERNKAEISKNKKDKTTSKNSKTNPAKPRYGDFDVEEAFKLALDRSYSDD